MRKIELTHDKVIPGWGTIKQGETFKVESFNKRFVYVMLKPGVKLRLNRKSDCKILY